MGVWPRECIVESERERPAPPADVPHGKERGRERIGTMNTYRFGTLGLTVALAVAGVTGCATKNYVRNQTAPLVEHTGQLEDKTPANNRQIGRASCRERA